MYYRLLFLLCLLLPGGLWAEDSVLQLKLQQVLKQHLQPSLAKGAVVQVIQSFPLQGHADSGSDGLSTKFSAELYQQTLGALAVLNVGVDVQTKPSGRSLDPCTDKELTNWVLTGHYRLVGDEVRIQLRICNRDAQVAGFPLITLQRAEVKTAGLEPAQRRPELAEALGRLDQALAPPPASASNALKIHLATDRGDNAFYELGDTMQLRALANRDCWFYVWHVDAKGEIQLLFPNYESRDNHLKAEQVRILGMPGKQDGSVVVGEPLGLETLWIVAQEHAQFSDYQEIVDSLSSPQPAYKVGLKSSSSQAEVKRVMTKGLNIMSGGSVTAPSTSGVIERLQPGQASKLTQFTVLPKR